jgi:PIN domain nuclease of toxin-antitoxin system
MIQPPRHSSRGIGKVDTTRLPEWSHKDPGDQLVVATARKHRLTDLSSNGKILAYPHVQSLASRK